MKRVLFINCLLFATIFSIQLQAQKQPMRLSLKEAIAYAIENSYNSKIAQNDIDAAIKRKWETTATGLPQINAKVDYQNWLKQQVSLFPAAAFDNTSAIVNTVEEYFNLSPNASPNTPEGFIPLTFGAKQNINATVTLTQLLFDGSYLVGLQSAKTYLKISEQAKEKTGLATREAIINAYGNVLVTEERIEILKQNKKNVDRQLKGAEEGFKEGLIEEETVQQFQITQGSIIAQQKNADRNKEIAYKMLNLALGTPINTPLILTDTLNDLVVKNTNLQLLAQDFNLDSHIDYQISKNDRESNRLLLKLEKSKALPSLSAFVNYGAVANSDTFSFFNSSQKWFNQSLLGVSLNIPLFSSLGRAAKTQQAKIALENADIRLEETKQRLNLQAEQAKSNYQLSIENFEIAKKNLDLATSIEKKQKIKFDEGISTSIDLLAARNQLYAQQNSYLQAILDIINNKAKLENALNIPLNQ